MNLDRNNSRSTEPDAAKAPGAASMKLSQPVVVIPDDALIIVPVRNLVLFPGMILPVTIGRETSVAAAQAAVKAERPIGLLLQRQPDIETPKREDLYDIGTVAQIVRYITTPDGAHHVVAQGEGRFRVVELLEGYPFLVARVERLASEEEQGSRMEARLHQLRERAVEALQLLPQTPPELVQSVQSFTSAGQLADMIAGFMDLKAVEKQSVLEMVDASARVDRVLELLAHRIEVLKLSREIETKTKATMDERQREYVLREQMRQIQKELGEGEDGAAELADLAKAIENAGMPEEVLAQAQKELKRLERMPDSSAEYSMVRTYLDWLIELPWKTPEPDGDRHRRGAADPRRGPLRPREDQAPDHRVPRGAQARAGGPLADPLLRRPARRGQDLARPVDRARARAQVRARVARRRARRGGAPRPPTHLHRRAAREHHPGDQEGRKPRLRDDARRGRQARAGLPRRPECRRCSRCSIRSRTTRSATTTSACRSTSRRWCSSPPRTCSTRCRDRCATGWRSSTSPATPRRRSSRSRSAISSRRQLEANGLKADQVQVGDAVLATIIRDYTREAGVRNLEREIGSVLRHAAVKIAEGTPPPVRIDVPQLTEILGPARFEAEVAERTAVPGVATGLAWTPVGGDILFVEASRTPGSGKLILTGQLGDVMKESAQAALTLVKSRCASLGIDPSAFEKSDVHVHVPAGAIPKDGPSAGVAMFMALTSLLTDRAVRNDTAMTGEISLRGLVLPVGGIKEKVLAAMRAGIKTVMLPAKNRKDLQDVPEGARERLQFVWLETVDDAARHALQAGEKPARAEAVG